MVSFTILIDWIENKMKFKRNLTFWVKAYLGDTKVNSWKFTIEKKKQKVWVS
jgi:hypothetical protein